MIANFAPLAEYVRVRHRATASKLRDEMEQKIVVHRRVEIHLHPGNCLAVAAGKPVFQILFELPPVIFHLQQVVRFLVAGSCSFTAPVRVFAPLSSFLHFEAITLSS